MGRHRTLGGSPDEEGLVPTAWARLGRPALVLAVGALGILALHHPMILSGFGRIQTDLGDSRLLNYFLEHGWQWVTQAPRHERFWDAPFFHPVPNVMAFSDCMISYGPFYWPLRAAGLAPHVAFGGWMVMMTALNYAAGVLLFRRGLGFGAPATAAAAGLIAFGSPRLNQLGRPQMLPFFYVLLALYALCRIARDEAAGAVERASWWVALGLATAAQFYGGYYAGWFFGVGLVVATAVALLFRASRGRVVALARRDWWAVALGATVAAVALIPFLLHYLPVAREFGQHFNDTQRYSHATLWSWWNVGELNWWWGWIDRRYPVRGTPFVDELRLGIGFLTTAACGVGFLLGCRRPLGLVALAVTLVTLATMTFTPESWVVHLASWAACFALACLFRQPDWSERGAAPLVLTTVAALLAFPPYNNATRSLILATLAFCVARMWRARTRLDGLVMPGVALAALAFQGLARETSLMLAGAVAPFGVLAASIKPARRAEAALGALILWLAATAWLTVESNPRILADAAVGSVLGWTASADARFRPGKRALATILAVALPIVLLHRGHGSLWLSLSPYVPGASVIRTPARVALMLLVPAGLALAYVIDSLDRRRWEAVAWCLVMLCLAEQAGTTSTFDREMSRRRIADVARIVDPRAGAFYYRPEGHGENYYHYHLDAMWASLEAKVPSINGISGCFPKGWWDLAWADSPHLPTTEQALQVWCDDHGLRRADVQRIGQRPPRDSTAAGIR